MNFLDAALALKHLPGLTSVHISFLASLLLCIAVVLSKRWHGSVSMDSTDGIQKLHSDPTPRIGGIPIVLGLIIACSKSNAEIQTLLAPILFAGMPAFLFGIAEDLTKKIGVIHRLLATMSSGLLAWWITDYSLFRLDIWGVDMLMQFSLISVIFTAFAVGGVANAINIIDGLNGYASLTCILAFSGFALIALQVGDENLAFVSLILAASALGFFCLNWPFGKLFLGDGGAYFLGFAVAWIGVLLIERNPRVSAFSALVICILPIVEVIFSIFRRNFKRSQIGKPDRLHFHSILSRRYIARWFSSRPLTTRNSIAGIIMALLNIAPLIMGNLFYLSTQYCLYISIIFLLGYAMIYSRMIRHCWIFPFGLLVKRKNPN
jgi:UDP-N-acetylmuramyl pentapeptide phosphotransferase/UDP-N-acetylglucosamine-1-phosphate transferase